MSGKATRDWRRKPTEAGSTRAPHSDALSEPEYMALFEHETRFARRYTRLETLGQGGMGEVLLCADKVTRRNVAVKRLDRSRSSKWQRERFLREARIQAQLDHPTIVPVYDIGIDDDGMEYFTMKRVSGLTLEQIIDQVAKDAPGMRERFSLNTRLGIFRLVCHGVEYAHQHGIVHRDLKPANVIIGDFGEVYLIDWGIAKIGAVSQAPEPSARGSSEGRDTGLGTPGYMPPEQLHEADSVDERADVYALGAILFELITLEPLHKGRDVEELLASMERGANAKMSERVPGLTVPPELEQVCIRATASSLEERLGSVAELSDAVASYLEGDRDLELRRTLAARHAAEAARIHADAAGRGGGIEAEVRQHALREAGRALALDPRSNSAIRVVTQLMSQLPAQVPPEVRAMYDDDEERFEMEGRRKSVAVYALHLVLVLTLASMLEVRNWFAVGCIFAPMGLALGVALLRMSPWRHKLPMPPMLLGLGAVLVTTAGAACFAGPYVITPGYIVAFGALSLLVAKQPFYRPRLWASMCIATFLVPVALELAGLLPVRVTFESSRLIVDSQLMSGPPAVLQSMAILLTLVSIATPMMFAYRMAARQRETRMQLFFQLWHLQNLAPARVTQG